jgi:uncharacterized membrane protein YphA (DoxX/SURF4 family)
VIAACSKLLNETWKPSPSPAALVRIAAGLWVLLAYPVDGLRTIARLPPSFWEPPISPLRFLDAPPSDVVLILIGVVMTVSTVLLVIGWRTPVAGLVAGLSLTLAQTLGEGYGAPRHRMILPTMLILMSASGWGNRFSVDALRGRTTRPRSWPIAVTLLFLAVSMFMAAWPKITTGWLDPSFSAVQGHALWAIHWRDVTPVLAEPLSRSRLMPWELVDIATVALESAFIVAVWRARWTRGLLLAAVAFHVGILLVLDIAFSENVLVYLVAFPLTFAVAVFDRFERRVGPTGFVVLLGAAALGAALGAIVGVPPVIVKHGPVLAAPFLVLTGWLAAVADEKKPATLG